MQQALKSRVIEERDNPLMRRKECWLLVEHSGNSTPSRKEMLGFLVRELKTKEELLIVDKMFSEKGKAATKVKVEVYASKADIPKHKVEKSASRLAGGPGKKKGAAKKPEGAKKPEAKEG